MSDQYETKPRYITSSSLPRRELYHDFKRSGSSSSLRGEEQHGYANMNGSYDGIPYQYGRDGSHGPTGQTQTVGTPSGIDYSYKGRMSRGHPHPFSQPIATERVQQAAKEMGDMKSWVGSVDGRSGVNDRTGDSGFRGSLGIMAGSLREGGQPRSLSERMVMEKEVAKAAKGRQKK